MENLFLFNLNQVKERGGTYYFEITKGHYQKSCWNTDSCFIEGDIWANLFDSIANEIIPNYDYYSFVDLDTNLVKIYADKLLKIAQELQPINSSDELLKPELVSQKTQKPYIHFDKAMWLLFASNEKKAETAKLYDQNFHAIILQVIDLYQQLAKWLMENGKKGVSILGI